MRFGFLIAALATIPVAHGYGQTQTTPTSSPPPAHSLANAYRGAFVCEKAPGAADILHVPVDLRFAATKSSSRGRCSICDERGS